MGRPERGREHISPSLVGVQVHPPRWKQTLVEGARVSTMSRHLPSASASVAGLCRYSPATIASHHLTSSPPRIAGLTCGTCWSSHLSGTTAADHE